MAELTSAEILAAAAGLDSSVKALGEPGPFEAAKFTTDFKSLLRPALNGTVTVRYPTFGDALKIEALSGGRGPYHEAFSTFLVCVEKAPEAWWYLPEGAKEPVLNLDKFPDSEGLMDLWGAFLTWRRTFRGGGA